MNSVPVRACRYLSIVALLTCGRELSADEAFEREAAPLLVEHCLGCHGSNDRKGGLDLTQRASALRGGESGAALVPGDPAASLLLRRIRAGEMPKEDGDRTRPLTDVEVATLERWIAGGARWPEGRVLSPYERTTRARGGWDWWSLQPIVKRAPPEGDGAHPVDRFLRAKLRAAGMQPAARADRRTLARRIYFDVTGLPPSPEEIASFVDDPDPRAYEKLVDRLLESPAYGERWARYWLDLVRFAETNGYERDGTKPHAWRYRDYVIRAFNDDKPFDRFVLEQLAGDELADRTRETVIATGFLRLGTWDDEPNDDLDYRYERLEDLVHSTSTTFLGMTVKCARCHDHKFDPIPQEDYYRLAGAFWAGYIPARDRKYMGGPSYEELGHEVLGWTDRGREVEPLRLLHNGDPRHPRREVAPGFLSLVPALDRPLRAPPKEARTTHRRLQLARWIVDRRNPLTARVFVNRLWQHHFGEGLVRSPNLFGFRGERPTHPDLLDWLAAEFVEGGWKVKRMHRLLLNSDAYRMRSTHAKQPEYEEHDFANELWWRAGRRRLEAEALRDSMLAVAGRLDRRMFGESFYPIIDREALEGLSRKGASWGASSAEERDRRSIYIFTKRSLLVPLMTTFDLADTTQGCAQRDVTTVAPQALALLNNQFVHGCSESFAERVLREEQEPNARIRRAFELAFGRAPAGDEVQASRRHVQRQREHFLARQRRLEAAREKSRAPLDELTVTRGLVLRLGADAGVQADVQGRVETWEDRSGARHHADQNVAESRPLLATTTVEGEQVSAIRFDGRKRFLALRGQVLGSQQFTLFAVASDLGAGGHREIFSNWNRNGNSVTSVFLGTTGEASVRFSDNFVPAGVLLRKERPFLLTAVSGHRTAAVYQGEREIARKDGPLARRKLDRPYVIGTQGDYGSEHWTGDILEVLAYDRELSASERHDVWRYLVGKYPWVLDVGRLPGGRSRDPELLAWASLCHVLLNANEFIYVD